MVIICMWKVFSFSIAVYCSIVFQLAIAFPNLVNDESRTNSSMLQVQALSEEKEAHACFLSMRHRQQDDEQHQFRKAWKRRRCSSGDDEMQKSAVETANRLGRLRRLQRYGYSGQRLGTTRSAVLTVEG